MHRLPALMITALCTVLLLGLCTTTAEAKSVSRVTGVARAGQDWQAAKLKIRWHKVSGAHYQVRLAVSKKRLKKARAVNTPYARMTTRKLKRQKRYFVQVRAVKRGRVSAWSKSKRIRFVRPRHASVGVHHPIPSRGTLFGFWAGTDTRGANTSARQNFARVRSYMGSPQVYRMFYSGLPQQSFRGSNADYGPPVVVSFKAIPNEVLSGAYDNYLRSWFRSIPSHRKVWWSYWHEPEDDIEDGRFTAAQYRAAWEHILTLAPRRSTLRATMILMGFSLLKKTRQISDYVPRGLDVLAWDSYLTGTTKTIENVINRPKAVSQSYGLGFAIAETAVAKDYNLPGRTHAETVAELSRSLRVRTPSARTQFVTWFESNKGDGDWRMRPYVGAVRTWRAPR